MRGALTRYRAIAYVVGVALLVLTAGVVVKYAGGDDTIVAVVGPVHGFLYIVYLVLAFDLARRMGWTLGRTALVLLAGTVPFLSFVAERWVTGRVRPRLASEPQPVRP